MGLDKFHLSMKGLVVFCQEKLIFLTTQGSSPIFPCICWQVTGCFITTLAGCNRDIVTGGFKM